LKLQRSTTEFLAPFKMVVVTSLGPPDEGVHHKEESTTTYINEKSLGKGTLYVSESRVSWVGDAGHKFSLEYPHISLHAVSRDTTTFPFAENIYLMIDVRLVDHESTPTPTSTPETSEDESDDPDDPGMTEIRFVPDNVAKLQDIFKAMSDCQMLHPDPEDENEDEDDDDLQDDGADGDQAGDDEDGAFDDADEEDTKCRGDNGHQEEPMEES